MVKVERNLRSQKIDDAREVLSKEKEKNNGSYNKPEVVEALKLIFNKKCYICESKKVTTYNIEHFRPHKDIDRDLKFDFDNLFLSCGHCNNIKLGKYENILDCRKIDVDELIAFRKKGNFAWNEKIEIVPLQHSTQIDETVELLKRVYEGTTDMKKIESVNIRKELRIEIIKFIEAINEYEEADGEDKEDAKELIKKHLKYNSPFAAFKRWIVRDNSDNLSEFLQEDKMKICI